MRMAICKMRSRRGESETSKAHDYRLIALSPSAASLGAAVTEHPFWDSRAAACSSALAIRAGVAAEDRAGRPGVYVFGPHVAASMVVRVAEALALPETQPPPTVLPAAGSSVSAFPSGQVNEIASPR